MLPTRAKCTPPVGSGRASGVGTGSAVPILTSAESSGTRRMALSVGAVEAVEEVLDAASCSATPPSPTPCRCTPQVSLSLPSQPRSASSASSGAPSLSRVTAPAASCSPMGMFESQMVSGACVAVLLNQRSVYERVDPSQVSRACAVAGAPRSSCTSVGNARSMSISWEAEAPTPRAVLEVRRRVRLALADMGGNCRLGLYRFSAVSSGRMAEMPAMYSCTKALKYSCPMPWYQRRASGCEALASSSPESRCRRVVIEPSRPKPRS
mmetsp:Transcript_14332/g.31097  ORF Transcript_14332/g.31097 Transcript_14332/m.31097 type:complete len:266 (-) Transcript_14332:358-1155(-)